MMTIKKEKFVPFEDIAKHLAVAIQAHVGKKHKKHLKDRNKRKKLKSYLEQYKGSYAHQLMLDRTHQPEASPAATF